MQPSEFEISLSVNSYEEKTAENYRNCFVAEKRMVSKLSKISILNFSVQNSCVLCFKKLVFQKSIVSKFYFPIICTFQEIGRQRALRSGRAGSSFYMVQLVLKWS